MQSGVSACVRIRARERQRRVSPLQKLYHGAMHFTDLDSDVLPVDMDTREPYYLPRIDEEVEVQDNVAIINVPVPRFGKGDPAYILHDFKRVRSASLPLHFGHPFTLVTIGRSLR